MNGPKDYYAKWSKSERERQISSDIAYMWNLKYDANEYIYDTETESQTQTTDLWLSRWRGMESGVEISRCRLLHTKWINKEVLSYRTRNYIQYPMISHNGNEYEKKVYICTNELCYSAQLKTTLQINYISVKKYSLKHVQKAYCSESLWNSNWYLWFSTDTVPPRAWVRQHFLKVFHF